MKKYTDFHTLANGNLVLTAANEARSDYRAIMRARGSDHAWRNVIEPFQENGNLHQVQPEWIGALTDAPILTDDLSFDDDGTPRIEGRVWWFPSYQVIDPMEELTCKGRVEFTLA
jgi:hypothetical protein